MKKMREALRGTKQVFSFTLRQFFVNRANVISLVIFFLVSLASMPAMTWLQGGQAEVGDERSALGWVAVDNRSDLGLQASVLAGESYWSGVRLTDGPAQEADAVATVTGSLGTGYTVSVSGSGEETELSRLEWDICYYADLARLEKAGLSPAQKELLWADYTVSAEGGRTEGPDFPDMDTDGEEENGMEGFWVQYGYAIVVMMLCLMASGYVIRAVVEEKGSKLIELLLLSVEPLALLTGKILAAMVYTVVMLALLVVGWAGSLAITAAIFGADSVASITGVLASVLPALEGGGLRVVGLALVLVVSLLLGYLTMSILGGLSGACCTGMDDMSAASGVVTMVTMVGYIAACAVSAVPGKGVAIFSALCPVLSMFCAPVQFVRGSIDWWVLGLSWLIQGALVCALAWLTARVYGDLIIYRGTRVKMKQLLGMFRGGKEAAQ